MMGNVGNTGPRVTVGVVYYDTDTEMAPTAPTDGNSTYDFDTPGFTTLPTGWQETPPTYEATGGPYWSEESLAIP